MSMTRQSTPPAGFSLAATSQNSIESLVISISLSLGVAGGGQVPIGVGVSGAGADATNSIQNTIDADVADGASVTAQVAGADRHFDT